jgi:putative redox protein
MVDIDVFYEGNLECRLRHGPSGAEIRTDAPKDNQGEGSAFSPTDLAAASLGACMLTIMGIWAKNNGVSLAGARAHVTKEMTRTPPRRIAGLTVTVTVPGVDDPQVRSALEFAARACPVHHSLHPDIHRDIRFVWA